MAKDKFDTYREIEVPVSAEPITVQIEDTSETVDELAEMEVNLDNNKRKKTFQPTEKPTGKEVTFGSDEPVEPEVVPKVPEKKPEQKRPSRSEKRIRELNAKTHDLEAQLAAERQARADLINQMNQTTKATNQDTAEVLENQIKSLTSQLRTAVTNAQTDLVVDIQDQLTDAKIRLTEIKRDLKTPVQEVKVQPSPQRQVDNTPDKALDWVDAHPEFKTDPIFYGAAMTVNNMLINEGFNPNSDEFYEELDARLSKRFPEAFDTAGENGVQYREEEVPAPSVPKDVQKSARATVSGASRTPNPSPRPSKGNPNTVKLTAEDVQLAERWGWSLERMAKRKLHMEKNKKDDGYVTINMNTETR